MKPALRTRLLHASLAVAVCAVMVGLLVTLHRADRLADGDTASLLAVETRVAQLLREGHVLRAAQLTWSLVAPQPPGGYLPGILTYTLLGARPAGAYVTMGLVAAAGAWGLWRSWGSRAWIAGLAIAASPMTWVFTEQHGRDVVTGCVLVLVLGELHAARGFRDRRASFAYGAWLGAGFLTKYTFPMFAVGPTLLAGIDLLVRPERRRWANLGVAVGGFALVALPWYLAHGDDVLRYVGFSLGSDVAPMMASLRDPWTTESLAYYPLALRDGLSLPGMALVLVAGVVGLARAGTRGRVARALAAAVGGVAVLSTAPTAVDRYALPALFALAAALPALCDPEDATDPAPDTSPRHDSPRRWALALLVAGLGVGVFVPQLRASQVRFAPGAPTTPARYNHPLASLHDLAWPLTSTYQPTNLDPVAWNLDGIARALVRAQGRTTGTVGFLGPRLPLNCPTYAQVLLRASAIGGRYDVASVNLSGVAGTPPVFVGPLFDGAWPEGDFDVAVVVAAPPDEGFINNWLQGHPHEVVARYPGPNGGWIGVVRMASTFKASAR
jgi:4-amino-4-deoxy-L-arabinose transferase-like glycosyltransferase